MSSEASCRRLSQEEARKASSTQFPCSREDIADEPPPASMLTARLMGRRHAAFPAPVTRHGQPTKARRVFADVMIKDAMAQIIELAMPRELSAAGGPFSLTLYGPDCQMRFCTRSRWASGSARGNVIMMLAPRQCAGIGSRRRQHGSSILLRSVSLGFEQRLHGYIMALLAAGAQQHHLRRARVFECLGKVKMLISPRAAAFAHFIPAIPPPSLADGRATSGDSLHARRRMPICRSFHRSRVGSPPAGAFAAITATTG